MTAVLVALWMIGALAIASAVRANVRTSLLISTIWIAAAWIAMGWWLSAGTPEIDHVAMAWTAASGVSVLGARWPGVLAWQFVVMGLLGVMHLPLIEAHLLGTPLILTGVRLVFLIGLIGTIIVNYLPTRFGLSAGLVGLWAALILGDYQRELARIAIAAAPLIAWFSVATRRWAAQNTDWLWRDFRDRFGAIWSLRVMEQFNRSAANSGSATSLSWHGLNGPDGPESYDRLCALLKRFGMPPT